MALPSQTLLVLVGLPGSGKSTLAQQFFEQGWAVINQDELGDQKACEAACWRALEAGQSVVIDRCNHTAMQRSHWLAIARRVAQLQQQRQRWVQQGQQRGQGEGGIRLSALCLEVPADLCLQRASAREGHATLPPEQAAGVIQRFTEEWQYPHEKEGFASVQVARSSKEAAAATAALLRQPTGSMPAAAAAAEASAVVAGGGGAVVEQAVPGALAFARVPAGMAAMPGTQVPAGGVAAPSLLSAGAASFQPGMPWQAAALLGQQQGWQMQPPQQGWQAQQSQPFTSRADAAGSWCSGGQGGAAAAEQRALSPSKRGRQQQQQGQAEQGSGGPQSPRQRSPPRARRAGVEGAALVDGQWQQPTGGMQAEGAGGPAGNVLPFPRRDQQTQQQAQQQQGQQGQQGQVDRTRARRHPWSKRDPDQPSGFWLDATPSTKPILMFDANGTVTSHTSMRRSAGITKPRPGIHLLRRLQAHYHVGMYSSASARTVDTALALLEVAAGPGPTPLFDRKLILHRSHTALMPLSHVDAGGKEWDTCKPLRPYFQRIHRVILIDDDSYKLCPGEESNLLLMPCWEEDDPTDRMVAYLVDVLLQLAEALEGDPEADVRLFTSDASARLQTLAQQEAAAKEAAGQQGAAGGPGQAAQEAWEEEEEAQEVEEERAQAREEEEGQGRVPEEEEAQAYRDQYEGQEVEEERAQVYVENEQAHVYVSEEEHEMGPEMAVPGRY